MVALYWHLTILYIHTYCIYMYIFNHFTVTTASALTLHNLRDGSLVSLAILEQKNINLNWYRGLAPLLTVDPFFSADHVTAFHLITKESYLDHVLRYNDRANTTRLRISTHRLEVELCRYNKTTREDMQHIYAAYLCSIILARVAIHLIILHK